MTDPLKGTLEVTPPISALGLALGGVGLLQERRAGVTAEIDIISAV